MQFKMVILPLSQALGPKEAQMLRDYVQQGGVLVADVRPGLYDGHCKPLASGSLDELFGVKRTSFPDAVIADLAIKGDVGGVALDASVARARVDTGIEAAGATAAGAAGKAPLGLANTFGKGKAMLLNFPLAPYPRPAAEGATGGCQGPGVVAGKVFRLGIEEARPFEWRAATFEWGDPRLLHPDGLVEVGREARRQQQLGPEGKRLRAGRGARVGVEQRELVAEQVVCRPVGIGGVEQAQHRVAGLHAPLERVAAIRAAVARIGDEPLGICAEDSDPGSTG